MVRVRYTGTCELPITRRRMLCVSGGVVLAYVVNRKVRHFSVDNIQHTVGAEVSGCSVIHILTSLGRVTTAAINHCPCCTAGT